MFSCEICSKSFNHKENKQQHLKEVHYGEKRSQFISQYLSPWSEEDIEIEKMKKEIDEIKRYNEKLLSWKRRYIQDYKDAVIRARDELTKYYKKIKEKNLHATSKNGKN